MTLAETTNQRYSDGMRRLLIATCAMALVAGLGLVPSGAPSAGAIDESSTTESTIADSSTTEPTTTTTTIEPTTTTTGPLVTLVPASRGTAVQVAPTLPPPTAPPTTMRPAPSPYAVPANSGTGRRVVYSKAAMRVWIIEASGNVSRTYLVSGRYAQPAQGTFYVFSRSSFTCHLGNSSICMRYMVRFTRGPSGDNIGFHEIPRKNGVPMQGNNQLGQALSAGCVRQSTADAQFMWAWAGLGTKVVVVW